jgi:hypothetical protein
MSVISGRTSKKYLFKKLVVSEKLLHLCTVKEIIKSMQRTFIISMPEWNSRRGYIQVCGAKFVCK